MAYTQDGDRFAANSDADLTAEGAGQYRAVVRTATGIALAGLNTAIFAGILQNNPALGKPGTVKFQGQSKAIAGGAVAINALLATDAAGRLVTATIGQRVVASANTVAAASGEVITVRLRPGLEAAP